MSYRYKTPIEKYYNISHTVLQCYTKFIAHIRNVSREWKEHIFKYFLDATLN